MRKNTVLSRILDFYLHSPDFNGILLSTLSDELRIAPTQLKRRLVPQITSQRITLVFASHSENPHIKRIADLPVEDQLRRLKGESQDTCCAYPTKSVILDAVDISGYDDWPFTKRILMAEPQLTPVFFDLDVLEKYYRDPRYQFDFRDYGGFISITPDYNESDDVKDRDKILLESFGIGYHKSPRYRVVAAYLRYLSRLPLEHQQLWNAHIVDEPCVMNSDYDRATVWGVWPEHHSVYRAFLIEQVELNKLATLIGKPPLFRQTYEDNRPKGFMPMLRPTRGGATSLFTFLTECSLRTSTMIFSRATYCWKRTLHNLTVALRDSGLGHSEH